MAPSPPLPPPPSPAAPHPAAPDGAVSTSSAAAVAGGAATSALTASTVRIQNQHLSHDRQWRSFAPSPSSSPRHCRPRRCISTPARSPWFPYPSSRFRCGGGGSRVAGEGGGLGNVRGEAALMVRCGGGGSGVASGRRPTAEGRRDNGDIAGRDVAPRMANVATGDASTTPKAPPTETGRPSGGVSTAGLTPSSMDGTVQGAAVPRSVQHPSRGLPEAIFSLLGVHAVAQAGLLSSPTVGHFGEDYTGFLSIHPCK